MHKYILLFLLISSSCFGSDIAISKVKIQEIQETQQDSLSAVPTMLADSLQVKKELKYSAEPAPVPLEFEEEKLQDLKKDPQFDYSEKTAQDNWWSRLKRYVILKYHQFTNWLFQGYEASAIVIFIVKLLPYLVLLLVVFLGVWIFNRMNPGAVFLREPEQAKVFLSEEEEIINTSDISELIRKAVTEENYRLAIRYYFLLILQQLTNNELISYEFSKTDEDYLGEIKHKPLQLQFKQLTRIYDCIWYGNFDTSKDQFLKSKKEFEKMQELIQNKHE